VKESELALTVGELDFAPFAFVEDGSEVGDFLAKRLKALDHDTGVVGEIACLHPDRGVALDAGEPGTEREPFLESADAFRGESVVRPLACLAGHLLGGEVAELLQPLRLPSTSSQLADSAFEVNSSARG
jgi:hypothetical protein